PVLTREKAKTIFGVFKNPRHALEFIPRVLDKLNFLCDIHRRNLKNIALQCRRKGDLLGKRRFHTNS
ncbi:MAG: hypothetical protein WC584_03330, partial [Candidatus Pacearchaeota archaeon]